MKNIIICTISGILYQLYILSHINSPPESTELVRNIFEPVISPQGVLNNLTRWFRELYSARVVQAVLNGIVNPHETLETYAKRGLNVYFKTAVDEEFSLGRIREVIVDAINMILGWSTYYGIARLNSST